MCRPERNFGATISAATSGAAACCRCGWQVLCLGEFGDLAWLDLSRAGAKIAQQAKLFNAPETWTLPALSDGLLLRLPE